MTNKKLKKQHLYYFLSDSLVFLSVLSFFCSDLSINTIFTIKPFHMVALITAVFLLIYKKFRFVQLSRVDKIFILFFIISFIGAIFSPFSIINSLKHILGVALLACSFYIFKILYSLYDFKKISKIIAIAGITIIIFTIVWYLIGLIKLGFNFNIKDTFCFGVRVDRKIPRLISFAYNEPNYVSIYFAILFSFFTDRDKGIINKIGMMSSLFIIILTMSRGGYIALVISLLIYTFFAKEKIKQKILKIVLIATAIILASICMTKIINATTADYSMKATDSYAKIIDGNSYGSTTTITQSSLSTSNNTKTTSATANTKNNKSALEIMFERFQKSFKDNGSNRLIHWEDAIKTFTTYPIFGIGTGNIIEYNNKIYERESPTHNSYLDVLSEQGVIGFIIYIAMIFFIIVQCWKIHKYSISPAMSFAFLLTSELFLSLAISDMLFINILMLDMAIIYINRQNNHDIMFNNENHCTDKENHFVKKPKLSFIVPIYNVEPYLARCLTSLISQTGLNYEIILVNDGSTDNSEKICKKYIANHKNIYYFKTKNNGLSAARNYGVKKAKGEYLWFVDGDDFIYNNALEIIKKSLEHDIVTINYYNYYDDYNISGGTDNKTTDNIAHYLISPAMAPLKIIKRKIFTENKLVFAVGKNYEDVGLMYSLINYTGDIYNSNEKLYFYRRRNSSISSVFSEKNFSDHLWAVKQLNKELGKGYDQEITYQSILQILFIAFDINNLKKAEYQKHFNELQSYLDNNLPQYRCRNKYLSKKTKKNLFYKIYLSKLMNGKYHTCVILNKIRMILTAKGK